MSGIPVETLIVRNPMKSAAKQMSLIGTKITEEIKGGHKKTGERGKNTPPRPTITVYNIHIHVLYILYIYITLTGLYVRVFNFKWITLILK